MFLTITGRSKGRNVCCWIKAPFWQEDQDSDELSDRVSLPFAPVNDQVICKSEEKLRLMGSNGIIMLYPSDIPLSINPIKFWQHTFQHVSTRWLCCFACLNGACCRRLWSSLSLMWSLLRSAVSRIALSRSMPQYAVGHQCIIKSRAFQMPIE